MISEQPIDRSNKVIASFMIVALVFGAVAVARMATFVPPSTALAAGVQPVASTKTSTLPPDAVAGAVRAWRAVGHVADYEGFSVSGRVVAMQFEAHATNEVFEVMISRDGPSSKVVDVLGALPRGSRPFSAVNSEPLNAQATNEVENVRLVPREDTEPGIAVAWSNFYKASVPGLGGDVCTVRLRGATGETVIEQEVAVDAPLNEAARDAVSILELPPPQGVVQPEPSVRCEEWRGPGFTPVGASRFTSDPPGGSDQGKRPDRGWVIQRLGWSGPEFGSVWECRGRAKNASGEVVASGTTRVYRNPGDTPEKEVNAAIEVEVHGDPNDVAATSASCRLINSELES